MLSPVPKFVKFFVLPFAVLFLWKDMILFQKIIALWRSRQHDAFRHERTQSSVYLAGTWLFTRIFIYGTFHIPHGICETPARRGADKIIRA